MGPLVPTGPGRVSSVVALLLGGLLLLHCRAVADEAAYLGVLTGLLGVAALSAGVRLWLGCRCVAPVCAVAVAAAVLTGQVLNGAAGLPGAPGLRSHMGATTIVPMVLDVALIGLVLTGGFLGTSSRAPRVSPWLRRS